MSTVALRIFYRKQGGQSVWTHELRGRGVFPMSVEQDLASVPDREGNGRVEDYGCYSSDTLMYYYAVLSQVERL